MSFKWSLGLSCLTICSCTLLFAWENACCSSLRKFSDFWHLTISEEILKKQKHTRKNPQSNKNKHIQRYKAWNRFWRTTFWSSLLQLLTYASPFQTNPLKLILLIAFSVKWCHISFLLFQLTPEMVIFAAFAAGSSPKNNRRQERVFVTHYWITSLDSYQLFYKMLVPD